MDASFLDPGHAPAPAHPPLRHRHADLAFADGRRTGPVPAAALGGDLLMVVPWPGAVADLLPDLWHESAAVAWLPAPAFGALPVAAPSLGGDPVAGLTGWVSRVAARGASSGDLLDRFAARHPTADLLGVGHDRVLLRLQVTGVVHQ